MAESNSSDGPVSRTEPTVPSTAWVYPQSLTRDPDREILNLLGLGVDAEGVPASPFVPSVLVEPWVDPVGRDPSDHASDEFVRAVLASSSDLVIVVDAEGVLTYASPASIRILGHLPEQWVGRSAFDLIHPDDIGLAAEAMVTSAESGTGVKEPLELRIRHSSGEWRSVEIVANNLLHDPSVAGLVVSIRDLSERAAAVASSRQHQRQFEQIFERAPIGMCLTDLSGRFLRVNGALCRIVGYQATQLLCMTLDEITHAEDRPDPVAPMTESPDGSSVEQRFIRANGSTVWVRSTASALLDDEGCPRQVIAQIEDIEEYRRVTAQLALAATHDPLTGLLNRAGLYGELDDILERAGDSVAVLFIDLDHFKQVNDVHGHGAGDELLLAVGRRLTEAFRGMDRCARLGGDEFVVLCREVESLDEVAAIAERARRSLARPFILGVGPVSISCSIGITSGWAQAGSSAVIAQADAAAYIAKRAGRDRVHLHR